MKIKVSELEGAKLDMWVAKADEKEVSVHWENCFLKGHNRDWHINPMGNYSPSTDWSQGGPIIEREKIEITPTFDYRNKDLWTGWQAVGCMNEGVGYGETPLIAAMRCYVSSKFGEEVEEA